MLTYYFRRTELRDEAISKKHEIVNAYQRLSEQDERFVDSVRTTTKSITNTFKRISAWGEVLDDVLNTTVKIPTLIDNRIVESS